MSENNDGGLAERGGTSNVSGTGSNFGGSGGPTGSGGSNSANVGMNMGTVSDKAAGTSNPSNRNPVSGVTNFTSVRPWGELLPGARAPVVPGFSPFANSFGLGVPRRDQTLGDIQNQNAIGNANFNAGRQNNGSNGGAGGRPQWTTQRVQRKNPKTGVLETVTIKVPIPQPKPTQFHPYMYNVPPNLPNITQPPYANPPHIVSPQPPIPEDQPPDFGTMPEPNFHWGPDPHGFGFGSTTGNNASGAGTGAGTGNTVGGAHTDPNSAGSHGMRFGGIAQPGQTYTVGENGPETLQMGPDGGGQVIPHNPMDRLGTMSPQMMQQQFQLMKQQWKGARPDVSGLQGDPRQAAMQTWRDARPDRPQMPGPGQPPVNQPQPAGGGDWNRPMPQPGGGMGPPTMPPTPQPPMAGAFDQGPRPPAMGQPQSGIGGLSRPQGGGGFGWGGNGFGQPGIAQHYGIR